MKLTLEKQITELILKFESILENCVIYDNGEIADYASEDFVLMEIFDGLNESISNVVKPFIQLISRSELEIADIPEIARFHDFESFAEFFKRHESSYPHTYKWSWNFVQWSTTYWDPLNWAIREIFHENPPKEISTRRIFELYFQGYVKISDETKYGWSGGYEFEILRTLETMKGSKFAMRNEITEIEDLESEIRSFYDDSSLKEFSWDFQGNTRNLEEEVWITIRRNLFGLFYDIDLDFLAEEELKSPQDQHNFEGLIMKWSSRPTYSFSDKQDNYWKVVEVNYPITIEQGEKKLEVIVPIVYQLFHRYPIGELIEQNITEEAQELWKASLLRVGTRDEYMDTDNLELLATITIALASALNCDLEKVSSEIDWLRIQDKDFPFIGKVDLDIRLYSQDYFDKNSL